MSDQTVHYSLIGGVATIRIDDGKRNALAPSVIDALYKALDRAEADQAIVILTGRDDVFSAGFDLKVMGRGGGKAIGMLGRGFGLSARVLTYPYPVIVACTGHVLAMGVFLMLAADHVIGTRGDFKVSANEVAIGMPMPRVAAAMLQHRLAPAAFQQAVTLARYFTVEEAQSVGFFDELADSGDLQETARERAAIFAKIDMWAHGKSKRRIRKALARRIRRSIPFDLFDAVLLGMRQSRKRSKG